MEKSVVQVILATAVLCTGAVATVRAQQGTLTPAEREQRVQTEKELESAAIIERKVMVPMRDRIRLGTDIYRPKNASGKVPVIWVRTPYNFNFWDVRNGVPADMKAALTAVKRGYAYVVQNERGHFFSEGNYDILGAPRTDGYDALEWLSSQSWANGKVGTTGCSSTAEYQMGDERPGLWRGFGPRRAILRTGQLVPRRRGSDAIYHVALWRAEPDQAHVPAEYLAGGFDSRFESI
jgi:uncharacterized protein